MMRVDCGTFWHLAAQIDTSREHLMDNVGHVTKKIKKV